MNSVSFILGDSVIKFQLSKKLFQKIPDDKESVYNDLFNRHEYYVQSKVRKEIFESFLEYWSNDTFPEINSDNILEYYQLNIEFGFFNDYFSSEKVKEPVYNLSYLLVKKKDGILNINEIERKIALNLDVYLDEYSKDLSKIPITGLYNIFFHRERNLKNEDKAYKFIIDLGESQNESFFILLSSLDAKKLTEENKCDSIYNKKNHFGFSPINTENSIDKVEKENKILFKQLEISKKNISELQLELKNSKQQRSNLDDKLKASEKEILSLKEINQNLTNELTDCKNLLIESSKALSEANNINFENSNQIAKLKKRVSELEDKTKNYEKEKLKVNQKLALLKSKTSDIKDRIIKMLIFYAVYLLKYI